jgi:hypothetical protein
MITQALRNLRHVFAGLQNCLNKPSKRRPRRGRLLELETLEDRLTPAPAFTGPAASITSTAPVFTWTTPAGAARYDLWVNNVLSPTPVINVQNLPVVTYTNAAPLPAGTYRAWVRDFTASGQTDGWSYAYQFTINPPATPTLTAPTGSISDKRPTFTWTSSPDAATYELWVDNRTTQTSAILHPLNLTTTSYTPTLDLPLGSYLAWVRAQNNVGNSSSYGAGFAFTIGNGPAIPTINGPATGSNLEPSITWTASAGATHYDLWVDNLTSHRSQVIREQSLSSNNFTPSANLTLGTYRAYVEALDHTNSTLGWSASFDFTITWPATPHPVGPSGLTGNATPTFSWDTVPNADHYDLWVDNVTPGHSRSQMIREPNLATNSFTSVPLDNGNYCFWVRAVNASGTDSYWSTAMPFTVAILTLSPESLTTGTPVSFYSETVSTSGGSGTYTYAVTSGSLPLWLTLNPNTGLLSGTPTSAGTATFTITASDSNIPGLTGSQAYTLTVNVSAAPLLHQSNLEYVGAFRVPNGQFGDDQYDTFSYGGTALAFNPANHSLFLVGYDQDVANISVPQSIVNSSNLDDLSTATVSQPFRDVLDYIPNNTLASQPNPNAIGGLAVVGGRLLGSVYNTYDGNGTAPDAHFRLSSLNLATASLSGYYQVGNAGGGYTSGYMTPVPAEWQSALGAPYLTGQADLNVISRSSSGPAAFGFNPSAVGSGVAPVTPYLYYPANAPLGDQGPANPLQSWTAHVNGVIFAPGSSSVLFFGSTGTNYNGYGEAADWGDNNRGNRGSHTLNGEYAFQVWAYDANDLVAVKQGTLQPWQVRPYDVWNFDLPISTGDKIVGGVAFDPASGRVFVSIEHADNEAVYSNLPLIEVFQLRTPGAEQAGPPHIGTLAVTPNTIAPGPVHAGTPVVLTAGNVYTLDPSGSAVQVAFYLDSDNDGIFSPGTDTLLGYGTASGHNWTRTISTTGMPHRSLTIFAQAMDRDGLLSDPIATLLTIA